ncbi:hotdog domain-containing protein [Hydrogenothermus marinus]|uniref:Acyl-coenzyme A thioesterase PaaI-like protein n=1 Tax=Hydrogenothermus marinus TaxID=133270 RepID=A0A3M0BJM3_9AQUI|nr:hotdog domain-containing protein [Hydrogenothermus marinus]RMA97530.1 acyl-coenzyme A thioesterase PaaI-like protein [Hydrogenothermus marinus]
MNIKTHNRINQTLSGKPIKIEGKKTAEVLLETTESMIADDFGLIHGGFIFSAADYCAMLTINHPNVVLAKSEVKFLKPVKVGEKVLFKSNVLKQENNKFEIEVNGYKNDDKIFTGRFYCVITKNHVLKNG